MFLKKFIGTKEFYRKVILIALPIILQNGITNFVGLLDNIMVGQVGTDQMSGVAIVNQLLFVFIQYRFYFSCYVTNIFVQKFRGDDVE